MLNGTYDALSSASRAAYASIPPHVKINELRLRSKMKRDQAIQARETDMALPQLLDDIKKTDEEMARRQEKIQGFISQLGQAPPQMPTQTNLSLGEGIAGALGALFGDANHAASAVSEAAQRRQALQYQNQMNTFAQGQQGAKLNLEDMQMAQEIARREKANLRQDYQQGTSKIADMKMAATLQDVENEQALHEKLISDAQDALNAKEAFKYKAMLAESERAWEVQKMGIQAELEKAKSVNANLDKRKSDKIDALIASLDKGTDPDLVDAVLDELDVEGIKLGEGARLAYQERARHNKRVEEFQAAGPALAGQRFQYQQGQDLIDNQLKAVGVVENGGVLPPALAGKLGVPGAKIVPKNPEGMTGNEKLEMNVGDTKVTMFVPDFFMKRPSFTGDSELNTLLNSTNERMTIAEQLAKLKPPTLGKNQTTNSVLTSDYEDAKAKLEAELAKLDGQIQTARMAVRSKETPEFAAWRSQVRDYVLTRIKQAEDSKFSSKKMVQDTWRKIYQMMTGDQKP